MVNKMNIKNSDFHKKNKITFRDIRNVFFRSNFFQGSWNFERMQSIGFCFSMIPIIRRLYPKKSAERKKAIRRHLEFFNTHPYMVAPILGITIALEEQKSNGSKIDDNTINNIKVGLMGPLAGVGDPIFWGTIRPVLSALGAGIAISGSFFGPILFFFLFNLMRLSIKYYCLFYGYNKGIYLINDMKDNVLKKITEGSSILGLFVMGALVNKWTNINIPVIVSEIKKNENDIKVTTIQNILDQLMPGIVPLMLTFLSVFLLKKRINPLWIIIGFFVFSIFGQWFGVLK
ncbi:PTS mannose transporter subunit IID [Candidatus Riesia sp. GBBU]|nr:PTS mannose transporter subunit IID [Candidatus Riesia sp. GBBU]